MYLYLCANRSVVLPLGAEGCRLGKTLQVEMRDHQAPGELVPGAVLEEVRVEILCSEPHVWNQKKVTKVIHLHLNKHGFTMRLVSTLLRNSEAVLLRKLLRVKESRFWGWGPGEGAEGLCNPAEPHVWLHALLIS